MSNPKEAKEAEIFEEYSSSLDDLTMNSKPLINVLTMLAGENVDHAAVIVQAVEKHLDKVSPDIKLPVLYLVDSILKNVGGPYTQLFTQIIVNMFCRVFKQVNEDTRSQMFKLRHTWNDVFPLKKLYQLDIKVQQIDQAWPIPTQTSNIHLNPNFLSNPIVSNPAAASTSIQITTTLSEKEMLDALARKEQELLLLQQKKIELRLEQTNKRLESSKAMMKTLPQPATGQSHTVTLPSAVVAVASKPKKINTSSANAGGVVRHNPSSPVSKRRDPRLARANHNHNPAELSTPTQNSFEVVKNDKNNRYGRPMEVVSSDLSRDDKSVSRKLTPKKDARFPKSIDAHLKSSKTLSKRSRSPVKSGDQKFSEKRKKITSPNKLPPIPKIKPKLDVELVTNSISPSKHKKDIPRIDKNRKSKSSPTEKRSKSPAKYEKRSKSPAKKEKKPFKYEPMEVDPADSPPYSGSTTFKDIKPSTKERNYIRRNKEKSESPEPRTEIIDKAAEPETVSQALGNGVAKKDIDLRVIPKLPENKKRSASSEKRKDSPSKKSKTEKFDALFGDEDVDLRKLPLADNLTPPPPAISLDKIDEGPVDMNQEGGWARVKEVQSPHIVVPSNKSHFALVRAKLAEATKSKDSLGRPFLYKSSSDDPDAESSINPEDIDMRQQALKDLENDSLGSSIKTILSQAEENLMNGEMDKQQYNDLLMQVLQISEAQKLKQAQQKDSLEMSKRRLNWVQRQQNKSTTADVVISDEDELQGSYSPQIDEIDNSGSPRSFTGVYGDIDERIAHPQHVESGKRPPLLPRPDLPYMDSDLRMHPMPYDMPRNMDMRFPGRFMNPRMYGKGWRGIRPRMDDRGFRPRGLLPPPNLGRRMPNRMMFDGMGPNFNNGPSAGMRQMECPLNPYIHPASQSPPPLGATTSKLHPVDPRILEYIDQDPMKTIHIDGSVREIRYYDKTAVALMNWDDPREIHFENGRRRIFFDDESFVLNLNDDYTNVTIDGQSHRIRFGGPTREVFIDDCWFECFFGGPSMPIILNNKVTYIKLEGPPPQVKIEKEKRCDLVAGKINLFIDAVNMWPVFLDAKVQKFEIEGMTNTLRFVDALETILINEKPYKVEFGGMPKPLFVGRKRHFLRFSVLPQGVVAGHANILNMEGKKPPILPMIDTLSESLPMDSCISSTSLPNNMETDKFDNDVSGGLDMLASLLPSSMAPPSLFGGYSVAEGDTSEMAIPGLEKKPETSVAPNINSILQNVNVNDLFAKLVATGIVSTLPEVTVPKAEVNEPNNLKRNNNEKQQSHKLSSNAIKPVNLLKSETLKVRQPGLISLLHNGMQCGSCGVRFPPEHTANYTQHLNWHFRQNRANRDSQRKPNSRRWYYNISDWIQYQEIEDLEEREKSWFEREQQAAEAARTEEAAVVAARRETSSVPLKSGAPTEQLRCFLCHDTFLQFYNHDTDEWHLKNAIEYEGNNYHPICLDDHKASLAREQEASNEDEENKTLIELDKENAESESQDGEISPPVKESEESQDAIQQDNNEEDESVVELLSEETATQESIMDDVPDVELLEEDDDVVIKNEPVEQIVVDDLDTDEETEMERKERDANVNMPIDFANIKIKQEPIDPDDEPIITSEEIVTAQVDTTHTAVLSSIDGNVQLEPTVQISTAIPGGIRINITKPLVSKEKEAVPQEAPNAGADEPPPPGEEPEIVYKLKPTLEGRSFAIQPPANRGSEMSGLCSIQ